MTPQKDLFDKAGNFNYTEFEKYFGEITTIINDWPYSESTDKKKFPVYMSDEDYVFDESRLDYNVDINTREMIKRLIVYRNEFAEMDREFGNIREKSISQKIYNEIQVTLKTLKEMYSSYRINYPKK